MKKVLFVLLSFFLLLFFASCNLGLYEFLFYEESVESRASSIDNLSSTEIPSLTDTKYSFVLFADIHVGVSKFYDNKNKFLNWFSTQLENSDPALCPKFLVSLGDNMNTGCEDDEYNAFLRQVKDIANIKISNPDFKTYSVLGNHDLYHNGWERFKKTIFPYKSAYKFSDGTFSYYFLDNANNTFGKKQRDAVESSFKNDSNPKIIFVHCPIYINADKIQDVVFKMQDTMERNWILSVFAKNNVKQIFSGHVHNYYGSDYGDFKENAIKAFSDNGTWYLVTVDKTNQTVTFISN